MAEREREEMDLSEGTGLWIEEETGRVERRLRLRRIQFRLRCLRKLLRDVYSYWNNIGWEFGEGSRIFTLSRTIQLELEDAYKDLNQVLDEIWSEVPFDSDDEEESGQMGLRDEERNSSGGSLE